MAEAAATVSGLRRRTDPPDHQPPAPPPRPLRHRQARRTGSPASAGGDAAGVRLAGGGSPDHRRGAHDDRLDCRFLSVPEGTDLVLIPGLCEGDTALISDRVGVEVEKGPKDLREIPQYFGRAALAVEYGNYDIEILAEINNAPRLQLRGAVRGGRVLPPLRGRRHRRRMYPGVGFPVAGAGAAGSPRSGPAGEHRFIRSR